METKLVQDEGLDGLGDETDSSRRPCPACGGVGGTGDDRCDIRVCERCDGTGWDPFWSGDEDQNITE